MLERILLMFSVLIALAATCFAQIDPMASSWGHDPTTCLLQVSNCPYGDFELVREGCGAGVNARIWVQVIDIFNNPVGGIPPTDIWFTPCNPNESLVFCQGWRIMDAPTDAMGRTELTLQLYSGGCAVLDGLQCVVMDPWLGTPIVLQNPPCDPDIWFKSPDMNADFQVNLSDLAIFAACYLVPLTPPCRCADYNDDGLVNLSDLAWFGGHYLHRCP